MQPTTVITVQVTAPQHEAPYDVERKLHVQQEGNRYFYLPDHIGDIVNAVGDIRPGAREAGTREVVAVSDHECTGLTGCGGACGRNHLSDECCVEEIDLPDYTEEN